MGAPRRRGTGYLRHVGDLIRKRLVAALTGPTDRYEEAVYGLTIDCAERPHQPLKELEVFIGFIMNKTGIPSRRQRDRSVKLKDEFERITSGIIRQMRTPASPSGYTSELDALELCLACLHVGCLKKNRSMRSGPRPAAHDIESFKLVAARALMLELNALEGRTL